MIEITRAAMPVRPPSAIPEAFPMNAVQGEQPSRMTENSFPDGHTHTARPTTTVYLHSQIGCMPWS